TSIADRYFYKDILGICLRIFGYHIEICIVVEDAGIQNFIFQIPFTALIVLVHQICIGEFILGILVKMLHIGVGGGILQIIVELLYVLPMIALGAGQPKKALL